MVDCAGWGSLRSIYLLKSTSRDTNAMLPKALRKSILGKGKSAGEQDNALFFAQGTSTSQL